MAATSAAISTLPLPSMLVQPCSTAANMGGFGGFGGWEGFAPLQYGTII
jgi:hypothetical protein